MGSARWPHSGSCREPFRCCDPRLQTESVVELHLTKNALPLLAERSAIAGVCRGRRKLNLGNKEEQRSVRAATGLPAKRALPCHPRMPCLSIGRCATRSFDARREGSRADRETPSAATAFQRQPHRSGALSSCRRPLLPSGHPSPTVVRAQRLGSQRVAELGSRNRTARRNRRRLSRHPSLARLMDSPGEAHAGREEAHHSAPPRSAQAGTGIGAAPKRSRRRLSHPGQRGWTDGCLRRSAGASPARTGNLLSDERSPPQPGLCLSMSYAVARCRRDVAASRDRGGHSLTKTWSRQAGCLCSGRWASGRRCRSRPCRAAPARRVAAR